MNKICVRSRTRGHAVGKSSVVCGPRAKFNGVRKGNCLRSISNVVRTPLVRKGVGRMGVRTANKMRLSDAVRRVGKCKSGTICAEDKRRKVSNGLVLAKGTRIIRGKGSFSKPRLVVQSTRGVMRASKEDAVAVAGATNTSDVTTKGRTTRANNARHIARRAPVTKEPSCTSRPTRDSFFSGSRG